MGSYDFVVVGGGIAGLRAAGTLAKSGRVLVCTKEALAESNTAYAQGGIAVAMGGPKDIALHLEDTITAGDGLVNREAAKVLVEQGPARVAELIQWGTGFDRYAGGELMRTREGAHSLSRILHANGDATGREIAVSLLHHVRELAGVELLEWTTTIDLVIEHGQVAGVTLLLADGQVSTVRAGAVLLASGGAGQVYSDTTNPAVATGDGIAMAYRAGAALEDMEFYQFHPTAFTQAGAPRFLLSEALRGEGAVLRNTAGERFMHRYHPGLELAPRDVVARAITQESSSGPVYLDMHEVSTDLVARFPGISAFLTGYGLQLSRDLIPVRPAAHYLMGGIKTDIHGRTTLRGLYAAGEAACTGVHGANRLASNSLLEGLVFGALAAEAMLSGEAFGSDAALWQQGCLEADVPRLREVMWHDAGLLRDQSGLFRAAAALDAMARPCTGPLTRAAIESRNLLTVAQVMVQAALGRKESRGGHFRSDFPTRHKTARHSLIEHGKLSWIEEAA